MAKVSTRRNRLQTRGVCGPMDLPDRKANRRHLQFSIWIRMERIESMKGLYRVLVIAALCAVCEWVSQAQGKRKVIIDQDAAGPGGTDMQAILAIVNSPETDVLGITVLTGDALRDA